MSAKKTKNRSFSIELRGAGSVDGVRTDEARLSNISSDKVSILRKISEVADRISVSTKTIRECRKTAKTP